MFYFVPARPYPCVSLWKGGQLLWPDEAETHQPGIKKLLIPALTKSVDIGSGQSLEIA